MKKNKKHFYRKAKVHRSFPEPILSTPAKGSTFRRKKPLWVRREIIRLKTLMPNSGCRKIADTFNRLYIDKYKESVSKSYVNTVIIAHRYKIHMLRQKLKHKIPKPLPKNIIWSIDLTTVSDETSQNTILGVIDNGSRTCLLLEKICDKSSISLLRSILDIIGKYGKPKQIRTDNEAVFTSSIFRGVLWLLDIKHSRTELSSPWQNGRIERLFGTFKKATRQILMDGNALPYRLKEFRCFYNHVRAHKHLDGRTPAEAWSGKNAQTSKKPTYWRSWKGVLAGYYFPIE